MANTRLVAIVTMSLIGLANPVAWTGAPAAEREAIAEMVGPGTVSTAAREFATSLLPDGTELYFNRPGAAGGWHIWLAEAVPGGFSSPAALWFSDARYNDLDPFVSRNGDRLYFSSNRPLPGAASEAATPDTNSWYAPRQGDAWGAPVFIRGAVNSASAETFVSESADGQLIFARFGEGSGRARAAYLMTAQRRGDGFSDPVQIPVTPVGLRLTNPAISPDGRLIIGAAALGGPPQLYISRLDDAGTWGPFSRLPAPINLEGARSFAPYIANDGKTLYFASDRSPWKGGGGDDIYRARLPE